MFAISNVDKKNDILNRRKYFCDLLADELSVEESEHRSQFRELSLLQLQVLGY